MTERQTQRNFPADDEIRIVTALRNAGIEVTSIFDLVKAPQPRSVPVLVPFLTEELDASIKEGLVRALSIRAAKPAALRPMIDEFRRPNLPDSLRWAVGNALEVLAAEEELGQLLELARDRRYGTARQMVVLGLGKLRDPRTVDVLMELLDDSEVQGHAIMALGKLGAPSAKPKIQSFLGSPKTWVRREAKKALQRIDRLTSTSHRE